jgi:hypothetical protein
MAYAEERQRCRRCYERWDFIKKIVVLYEEGVSWEGCTVITPADPDKIPSEYSEIIGIDAIKDGVRGMMVEGVGEFETQIQGHPRKLSILAPPKSPLRIEAAGQPFLWPYIQNDQALEKMAEAIEKVPTAKTMVNLLIEDMCRGLGVPRRFLQNVVADEPIFVKDALITFRYVVGEWRRYIAFHLREEIGPLICKTLNYEGPVEVVWNKEWLTSGMGEYGPVYHAFRAQGILLEGLAQGMIEGARQLWEASLIKKEEYEDAVRWFG